MRSEGGVMRRGGRGGGGGGGGERSRECIQCKSMPHTLQL